MKKMYVPKSAEDKQLQRVLLQYRKKENYRLVLKALQLAHREDLIGFDKKCLIKPTKEMAIKNRKAVGVRLARNTREKYQTPPTKNNKNKRKSENRRK